MQHVLHCLLFKFDFGFQMLYRTLPDDVLSIDVVESLDVVLIIAKVLYSAVVCFLLPVDIVCLAYIAVKKHNYLHPCQRIVN